MYKFILMMLLTVVSLTTGCASQNQYAKKGMTDDELEQDIKQCKNEVEITSSNQKFGADDVRQTLMNGCMRAKGYTQQIT